MAVYRFLLIIVLSVMYASGMSAQTELVRECRQKSFPKSVPPGNYSGITHIGGNKYLQGQTKCKIYAPGIDCAFTNFPILESSFLSKRSAAKTVL